MGANVSITNDLPPPDKSSITDEQFVLYLHYLAATHCRDVFEQTRLKDSTSSTKMIGLQSHCIAYYMDKKFSACLMQEGVSARDFNNVALKQLPTDLENRLNRAVYACVPHSMHEFKQFADRSHALRIGDPKRRRNAFNRYEQLAKQSTLEVSPQTDAPNVIQQKLQNADAQFCNVETLALQKTSPTEANILHYSIARHQLEMCHASVLCSSKLLKCLTSRSDYSAYDCIDQDPHGDIHNCMSAYTKK